VIWRRSNAAQLLFPDKREVIRHLHYRLIDTKDSICRAIEEQSLNATMLQKEALKQWSSRVDVAVNATLSQQKVIAEYDPEMALRRGYAMIKGDLQIGNIVEITTKDIIMKVRRENYQKKLLLRWKICDMISRFLVRISTLSKIFTSIKA